MNPDRLFDSLREQVKGLAPSNMDISSIEFEGPIVAIYVRNYDEFSGNVDVAKNMAMSVRRRVDIRPDPSTLEDPDKVEKKIRSMIPDRPRSRTSTSNPIPDRPSWRPSTPAPSTTRRSCPP